LWFATAAAYDRWYGWQLVVLAMFAMVERALLFPFPVMDWMICVFRGRLEEKGNDDGHFG
jgi:hypothetical protein